MWFVNIFPFINLCFLFFPQHVLEMINSQFKKIYEDDVQMPDWAQKTIGKAGPSQC